MNQEWPPTAREKLQKLAQSEAHASFVVGYLTSGFSEKQVEDVVQAALEFAEGMAKHSGALGRRYRTLLAERFR
jgi:hypothetical protein